MLAPRLSSLGSLPARRQTGASPGLAPRPARWQSAGEASAITLAQPRVRCYVGGVSRPLFSIAFWSFLAITSLLLFPVAVVIWALTAPFDRRLVLLHRFTCFWASLYTWLNPAWPVTVEGRERVRPGVPYVMISNHQSLLDILVLFRLFVHFKWVSKVENFRIPLIGWNMRMNRYIELKRGNRASVVQMMGEAEKTLRAGNPIMMFPEGTRSVDGRLRSFKSGAFELAKKLSVPILPIVLEGTGNALPKHGFVLQGRHPIRLRLLDEIPPESFAALSTDELMAQVRDLYVKELHEEPAATEPR